MIDRHACGLLPDKPHTVHRTSEGALLYEEMHTRGGFEGPFSYFYHLYPITAAKEVRNATRGMQAPKLAEEGLHPLKRRLYDANLVWDRATSPSGQLLDSRVPILFNEDVTVILATADREDDMFFANNDGDELWYITAGAAELESVCGRLPVETGDYVHIPKSMIHRWKPASGERLRMMCIEGKKGVYIPSNYRNPVGQLAHHAPYTERDFKKPRGPIATPGNTPDGPKELLVKKRERYSHHVLERCPLDVVGWDGFVYPFAFPIEKYSAKAGQVHLPPTVHTTFVGPSYVICSFVPRALDFHKDAIPCPYPHSSVDCDEVLLYLKGNFTSRRGVGPGCMSLHPSGVAHGPHPGAYEASIGVRWTDEMAVMLDTFSPLNPTQQALEIENAAYHDSWRTA